VWLNGRQRNCPLRVRRLFRQHRLRRRPGI